MVASAACPSLRIETEIDVAHIARLARLALTPEVRPAWRST